MRIIGVLTAVLAALVCVGAGVATAGSGASRHAVAARAMAESCPPGSAGGDYCECPPGSNQGDYCECPGHSHHGTACPCHHSATTGRSRGVVGERCRHHGQSASAAFRRAVVRVSSA